MSGPMPIVYCAKCAAVAIDFNDRDSHDKTFGTFLYREGEDAAFGVLCKSCLDKAKASGTLHVADPHNN